MTPTQLKEAAQVMLAVAAAEAEGKPVQVQCQYRGAKWEDIDCPSWNWDTHTYRIKPEPREWWLGFDTDSRVSVFFVKPAAGCLGPGERLIKVREVIP